MHRQIARLATHALHRISPRRELETTPGAAKRHATSLLSAAADLGGLMNMAQGSRAARDEASRS